MRLFPALAATLLSLSSALAKPAYTVREIENYATGYGLTETGSVLLAAFDDVGDVDGYAIVTGETRIALSSDNGTFQPSALNGSGGVVGTVGYNPTQAVIYSPGTSISLGSLGGTYSAAKGINSLGQIVGYATTAGNASHAFLYQQGVMKDLGTFGGTSSAASAINDAGQITGSFSMADGSHAFLYTVGQTVDLGSLKHHGNLAVNPRALNRRGQVVGSCAVNANASHAFFYSGGKMTDLGTFGGKNSQAADINDHGQIVGYANISHPKNPYITSHAFLFEKGRMTDLNTLVPHLRVVLSRASAINNLGQIVANSPGIIPKDGAYIYGEAAFLLSPVPTLSVLGGETRTTSLSRITIRGRSNHVTSLTYARNKRKHGVHGTPARWHFTIALQPGENVITLTARGLEGSSARTRLVITRS